MTTSKSTESVGANSRPPPGQTKISDFDSDNGHCQWLQLDSEEIRQPDVRIPHAIRATERNKDWKTKSPENFSVLRALGIAKVAVKKRFELLRITTRLKKPFLSAYCAFQRLVSYSFSVLVNYLQRFFSAKMRAPIHRAVTIDSPQYPPLSA